MSNTPSVSTHGLGSASKTERAQKTHLPVGYLSDEQREAWMRVDRYLIENPGKSVAEACTVLGIKQSTYLRAQKKMVSDNREAFGYTVTRVVESKPREPVQPRPFVPSFVKSLTCPRCQHSWEQVTSSFRPWIRCVQCNCVLKGAELKKAMGLT